MNPETEEEAYIEWMTQLILEYLAVQLKSGRTFVMEEELWQMMGHPMPEGVENRKFVLREYFDNVIPVDFMKRTLH